MISKDMVKEFRKQYVKGSNLKAKITRVILRCIREIMRDLETHALLEQRDIDLS